MVEENRIEDGFQFSHYYAKNVFFKRIVMFVFLLYRNAYIVQGTNGDIPDEEMEIVLEASRIEDGSQFSQAVQDLCINVKIT